jgi:hypothetical protein
MLKKNDETKFKTNFDFFSNEKKANKLYFKRAILNLRKRSINKTRKWKK